LLYDAEDRGTPVECRLTWKHGSDRSGLAFYFSYAQILSGIILEMKSENYASFRKLIDVE